MSSWCGASGDRSGNLTTGATCTTSPWNDVFWHARNLKTIATQSTTFVGGLLLTCQAILGASLRCPWMHHPVVCTSPTRCTAAERQSESQESPCAFASDENVTSHSVKPVPPCSPVPLCMALEWCLCVHDTMVLSECESFCSVLHVPIKQGGNRCVSVIGVAGTLPF